MQLYSISIWITQSYFLLLLYRGFIKNILFFGTVEKSKMELLGGFDC